MFMIMKKLLFLFIAFTLAAQAWAEKVEFGGIYYELSSSEPYTATVVRDDSYANLTSVNIQGVFTPVAGKTYTTTEIEAWTFGGCTNITSITIPNTVTKIGDCSFNGCTGLTSVVIPSSAKYLGTQAFINCTSLQQVTVESSDITIAESAFEGCSSLTAVNFTNANPKVALGGYVFDGCTNMGINYTEEGGATYMEFLGNKYFQLYRVNPKDITTFEINSNCKSIGDYAFSECENLTQITIPNGVLYIGRHAFERCGSLMQVVLPNTLTNIDDQAFGGCVALSSIEIPGSVKKIGGYSFGYCDNLKQVVISEGVEEIGDYPFTSCNSLEKIILPSSLTRVGYFGLVGTEIKEVTMPSQFAGADADDVFRYIYETVETVICDAASKETCSWWRDGLTKHTCVYVWNSKNKTLTAQPNEAGRGEVTGSGKYAYGAEVTIAATAGSEYKFVGWSDGNHDNPRTVVVKDNEADGNSAINTYTAVFYPKSAQTYDIVTDVKGKGSVTGGGIYLKDANVTLTATPSNTDIYHFVGWSNGSEIVSSDASYTFSAKKDLNLTAIFEGKTVTVGNTTVHAIGRINDNAVFRPTLTGRYTISSASEAYDNHYGCLRDENGEILKETYDRFDENGNFRIVYNLEAGKTYYIGVGFYEVAQEGDIPLSISNPQLIILTADDGKGTVSGAGFFDYNSTTQIEAKPNAGHHFVQWQDGNTTNPRTITVTESATYTASFAINEYEISATGYENGTIEGTGTYQHGATVTLTAEAAEGYHFVSWGDDNTENPRIFTAAEAVLFLPSFAINTYTVTATGEHGTFTGAGTYNHGDKATITAIADEGYDFGSWRSGQTTAQIDTIVKSDVDLVAIFIQEGHHLYTISVAEPENGTVSGAGVYEENTTATLTATPAEGYHFVKWSDNVTDATRSIEVKGNVDLSATFAINKYTITATAGENGKVAGAGEFVHGTEISITATPNEGYHFVGWNDGGMDNPRQFVATEDSTLRASFEINSYKVTAIAENGSVSGLHSYTHGSEATLTVNPEYGYHFVAWADGETSQSRTFVVTEAIEFTALFEINTYTATVTESEHGEVSGAGEYTHGEVATFTATAESGYQFLFWNDGSKVNPRNIKMTQDVDIRAVFSLEGKDAFNVTVGTNGNGTVKGAGLYIEGETATIEAIPESEAYHFVEWSDGETANPREVTVDNNISLTATFAINTYTISASTHEKEAERGEVSGSGTYTYGTMATLRATPAEGFRFVNWSDGDIYNIKFINVTEDLDLTAHFAPAAGTDTVYITIHDTIYITVHDTIYIQIENPTGIAEHTAANLKVYPNPTAAYITVKADRDFSYVLYDLDGTPIRREENGNNYVVNMSGYPKGVYLLRTSDGVTHKIIKK